MVREGIALDQVGDIEQAWDGKTLYAAIDLKARCHHRSIGSTNQAPLRHFCFT
jgi:hypothetical protein